MVARCRERHQGKIRKDKGNYRITWERSGKTASFSEIPKYDLSMLLSFRCCCTGTKLGGCLKHIGRSWITLFAWEVEKDAEALLADAGQKNEKQKTGGHCWRVSHNSNVARPCCRIDKVQTHALL